MAAVYPSGIKSFGPDVVDNSNIVYAAHINDLRKEVEAVEGELGTGLKTSTWTGAFATTGSWGSLAQRLINIERGIVGDSHTHYLKIDGSNGMAQDLAMGNHQIKNLAAGTLSTDAVNKGQLDPATNPSYCEGVRTSSSGSLSSVVGWVVTYTSETDAGGILDAGTGVMTLPVGLWLVSGYATVTFASSSSALDLRFFINGTGSNFSRTPNPGTGSYAALSVTEVIRVTSPVPVSMSLIVGGLGVDWYCNQAKLSAVRIGSL